MALFEIPGESVAGARVLELTEEQCDPVFTVLDRNLLPPDNQEDEKVQDLSEKQPAVEMIVERVMTDLPNELRRIVSSAAQDVFSKPA